MLDEESRQLFLKSLREAVAAYGLTVIYITHDLREAGLASRSVAIDEGRIIAQGKPGGRVVRAPTVTRMLCEYENPIEAPSSLSAQVRPLGSASGFFRTITRWEIGQAQSADDHTPRNQDGYCGRSGVGKSTLLLRLAGLLPTDGGVFALRRADDHDCR